MVRCYRILNKQACPKVCTSLTMLVQKMAPQGQQSELRLATTLCDNYEANWNGQTDRRKSHVLSQADALNKNKDEPTAWHS